MDSGDQGRVTYMSYGNSKIPVIGPLVDYLDTSIEYLRKKNFSKADRLQTKSFKVTISATFMTFVCLVLGFVCNLKFEVVTFDEEALPQDLHIMLMSKQDDFYVDDIDVRKVMWCIEASDVLSLLISCLLVLSTHRINSPLTEHMYLPWLGVALRGLIIRQAPTAIALMYTMTVIQGTLNPLFATTFTFLFLLETRLWLEIARLLRARWEHYHYSKTQARIPVETLWKNDDVQSIEMKNFVY